MASDSIRFLRQGIMTDAGSAAPAIESVLNARLAGNPAPVEAARAIADMIHASFTHIHLRWLYPVAIPDERAWPEASTRSFAALLERLAALGDEPFGSYRPRERRVAVTCRTYAVAFASLLRMAAVPARCRCGFASYLGTPDFWCDHWIVERWDGQCWVASDAQIDEQQAGRFGFQADPMALAPGAFRSAGEAWLACRTGDDPQRYGMFEMKGWDFVKGNLLRDVAALAGTELLPWDFWGLMLRPFAGLSAAELEILDRAARATPMLAPDMAAVDRLAALDGIRVPSTVKTLDVTAGVPGQMADAEIPCNQPA